MVEKMFNGIDLNVADSVKNAMILGVILAIVYSIASVRICHSKPHTGPVNGFRPYLPKVIRMGREKYRLRRHHRTILFPATSTDGLLAVLLALALNRAIVAEHYHGVVQIFLNISPTAVGTAHLFGAITVGIVSTIWYGVMYMFMQVIQHLRAISLTAYLRGYGFQAVYAQRRSFGFFLKCVFSARSSEPSRIAKSETNPNNIRNRIAS